MGRHEGRIFRALISGGKRLLRLASEKVGECQQVEPDEVLRIVRVQPQAVFERRYRLDCATAKKLAHSQERWPRAKLGLISIALSAASIACSGALAYALQMAKA